MGVKRGSLDGTVALGALAKGANSSYHQRNSITAGLSAHASGIASLREGFAAYGKALGDWANHFETMGKMADKAFAAYSGKLGAVDLAAKNLQRVKESGGTAEEIKIASDAYSESLQDLQYNNAWWGNFKGSYGKVDASGNPIKAE